MAHLLTRWTARQARILSQKARITPCSGRSHGKEANEGTAARPVPSGDSSLACAGQSGREDQELPPFPLTSLTTSQGASRAHGCSPVSLFFGASPQHCHSALLKEPSSVVPVTNAQSFLRAELHTAADHRQSQVFAYLRGSHGQQNQTSTVFSSMGSHQSFGSTTQQSRRISTVAGAPAKSPVAPLSLDLSLPGTLGGSKVPLRTRLRPPPKPKPGDSKLPLPPLIPAIDNALRRDNRDVVGYRVIRHARPPYPPPVSAELGEEGLGSQRDDEDDSQEPDADSASAASLDQEQDTEALEPVAGVVISPTADVIPVSIRLKAVFAVIQIGSHQFKVTPGDVIYTEKLLFADVNDTVRLSKVLLLGSRDKTVVGRPTLQGAHVDALVEEQALDAKVIVFKKKRRKNYRRHRGHRQELTRLRILDVKGLKAAAA